MKLPRPQFNRLIVAGFVFGSLVTLSAFPISSEVLLVSGLVIMFASLATNWVVTGNIMVRAEKDDK